MTRHDGWRRLWQGVVPVVTFGAVAALATASWAQLPAPEKAGRPIAEPGRAAPTAGTSDTLRFGSARPIAKPAGALRISVYNVENLFDDHDDPALSGANEDKDMTKPASQREAAAAAIRAIDADVLGLVEVESERAVTWFRDEFLADMGYVHIAAMDAGDARGIEQVVLSRYPLGDAKNWVSLPLGGTHPEKWGRDINREAGKPITFHRSPLCVTVTVPTEAAGKFVGPDGGVVAAKEPYQVTLFVVHQKSGAPGGYWREKEAAKTIDLVKEMQAADADRNILVMGDFNAKPEDKPVKMFTEAGLIDLFAHRKRGDASYVTHESGRVIDFILMNSGVEKELIRETRFILGTPARPQGVDYRTTPGPTGYASDHYPVVMDLVPVDR